ncbi:phosphohistidine phosphatase SixA [Actinobacillus pleuropneumoniae]|uniref:phosphohistidine phosphatase SixA n=1 Tax=Actinobacillus pleuropneumoniae TaxID=715 RepID=UPI00192BA7AD|nr:phosphohistidine phosphatase SixA [Actinobacillus pleuropneumoniae]MBL4536675.1 phosphohistidine phosphatase SixA [Actinobacillus pleuropneumoniae]MCI1069622.1 phosphohistidine phosphatase SixA [Actinobacillus pleuropneumoniae]
MNIWIMRHGEAGFNVATDSERPLTENGRKTAYKQGQWLAKRFLEQSIVPDKVIVSPYLRAQQTFEALNEGMQAVDFKRNLVNSSIEIWEGVTPGGDPENVKNYLDFLREEGAKNILIVSHLPLVYDLVVSLTQHQDSVHFYPAVIAEIDWKTDFGKVSAIEYP